MTSFDKLYQKVHSGVSRDTEYLQIANLLRILLLTVPHEIQLYDSTISMISSAISPTKLFSKRLMDLTYIRFCENLSSFPHQVYKRASWKTRVQKCCVEIMYQSCWNCYNTIEYLQLNYSLLDLALEGSRIEGWQSLRKMAPWKLFA